MAKLIPAILTLIIAISIGYHYSIDQVNQPLDIEKPVLFKVNKGISVSSLTKQLVNEGWLKTRFWLRNYTRIEKRLTHIKAGTYLLEPGMTGLAFLEKVVAGQEHQFQITFVEGTTFKDWLNQLAKTKYIINTLELENSTQELLVKLGINESHPEGVFFPDTYLYTADTTDVTILKRAYLRMREELETQWQQRAVGLPYENSYQALIMASIIEKETALLEEQGLISAVFVNRLNKKMRLQTDPTVIYGLGERFTGDLTFANLREKTAYNTYKINGLPPTPIAMPGLSAIRASLNPVESDYLYFVSKGNGAHQFSKTLKEHNKAVKRYQLKK